MGIARLGACMWRDDSPTLQHLIAQHPASQDRVGERNHVRRLQDFRFPHRAGQIAASQRNNAAGRWLLDQSKVVIQFGLVFVRIGHAAKHIVVVRGKGLVARRSHVTPGTKRHLAHWCGRTSPQNPSRRAAHPTIRISRMLIDINRERQTDLPQVAYAIGGTRGFFGAT